MDTNEKHIWTMTDLAKFLGCSVGSVSVAYKNEPENLPPTIRHSIGKKPRWLDETVLEFYRSVS